MSGTVLSNNPCFSNHLHLAAASMEEAAAFFFFGFKKCRYLAYVPYLSYSRTSKIR